MCVWPIQDSFRLEEEQVKGEGTFVIENLTYTNRRKLRTRMKEEQERELNRVF